MTLEPNYQERDFNTRTKFTRMACYIRSIYPDHVREHAREILSDVQPGTARYRYAAALTQHVYQEIEYSVEEPVWRADYILDQTQKGDCEDQAALLASLLTCRSFPIRYIVVEKEGSESGHVMLEVLLNDVDLPELIHEADDFYQDYNIRKLAWEHASNGYWLLCNTVASPIAGTYDSRYFHANQDGQIIWNPEIRKDVLEPP